MISNENKLKHSLPPSRDGERVRPKRGPTVGPHRSSVLRGEEVTETLLPEHNSVLSSLLPEESRVQACCLSRVGCYHLVTSSAFRRWRVGSLAVGCWSLVPSAFWYVWLSDVTRPDSWLGRIVDGCHCCRTTTAPETAADDVRDITADD
uniref:Uncharacterized protein n=1 Tax=Glossina pallidipes TaxID=7398 RepID=A0A1A9ZAG2_GLOPL